MTRKIRQFRIEFEEEEELMEVADFFMLVNGKYLYAMVEDVQEKIEKFEQKLNEIRSNTQG